MRQMLGHLSVFSGQSDRELGANRVNYIECSPRNGK